MIIFKREKKYNVFDGPFHILVDGKKTVMIKQDEDKEIDLSPGTYTIQLKRWIFKSNKMEVKINEDKITSIGCYSGDYRNKYRSLIVMRLHIEEIEEMTTCEHCGSVVPKKKH